jgi:hypothetical protein
VSPVADLLDDDDVSHNLNKFNLAAIHAAMEKVVSPDHSPPPPPAVPAISPVDQDVPTPSTVDAIKYIK